jgi:hypothetical protein
MKLTKLVCALVFAFAAFALPVAQAHVSKATSPTLTASGGAQPSPPSLNATV